MIHDIVIGLSNAKQMKIIFRILFWALIGLIIALILLPFLFKGQIHDAIKNQVNDKIHAEVNFADASISLFKNFPNVAIDVDDITIDGTEQWSSKQLFSAKSVSLKTDLKSIIKPTEGINIRGIIIENPVIDLVVNESGQANYDIIKESDNKNSTTDAFGEIDNYEVIDGQIIYADKQNHVYAKVKDLDHQGRGEFRNIQFDLMTSTSISELDFSSGGIKFLNSATVDADVALEIDGESKSYKFKENSIKINDLDLSFVGTIIQKLSGFGFDLAIEAPNNKVSSILSLIPTAYKKSVEGIQSKGNSFVKGTIKGNYNGDQNVYPQIDIGMDIENGEVKYPNMPLPIKDINLDIDILNKSKDLSDLTIDMKKVNFKIEDNLMTSQLKVENALSKPHLNGLLAGTLDLKDIASAYPLEGVNLKEGLIKTNISIDAAAEDVEAKNFKNINFNGTATANDIDLLYENYPIKLDQIDISMKPANMASDVTNLKIGNSDFTGDINVNNPLAFITDEAEADIDLSLNSDKLDVNQILSYSEEGSQNSSQDTVLVDLSFYKDLNINANYTAKNVEYETYDLKNLSVTGAYKEDLLKLASSQAKLDGTPIALRGELNDLSHYVFLDEKLRGKLFFDANKIDANKYISESEVSDDTSEAVLVPENLAIDIYPEINELRYDNYILNDVKGKIAINNSVAQLVDGQAKAMDGKILLDGIYDTSDPVTPLFDVKLDLNSLNFSKVFETSPSFKILVPVAEYINGLFHSTLVFGGPLGQDMLPELDQVTASGYLETLKGKISGFGPLENIGNAIGIDKLSNLDIKGSKNWFEVKDGKVILKPHEHKIDDMAFTVGGTHSISQELDYTINAVIPRDKLKKDKLGKNLEFGMGYLEEEATKRGVNIDLGDLIYLDIFITGTLKNPKIKVLPVGSGGKTLRETITDEVHNQVEILKDTIRTELENKTEEIKDTVRTVVETQVDKAKTKAEDAIKSELDKQKDAIKDKLKGKVDSTVTSVVTEKLEDKVGKAAKDVLGKEATTEIDSLKEKLNNWNPFKKKKN